MIFKRTKIKGEGEIWILFHEKARVDGENIMHNADKGEQYDREHQVKPVALQRALDERATAFRHGQNLIRIVKSIGAKSQRTAAFTDLPKRANFPITRFLRKLLARASCETKPKIISAGLFVLLAALAHGFVRA